MQSLTPEHDKRPMNENGLHPDVKAAYHYGNSVSHTSDLKTPRAWYGWALREAFLAGVSHAQKEGN
ncbi:hypothetical protein [Pseudoalteromonas sp. Of7M-16]|uniref:hypothetical protein n=1 Tax=Pseudoalteromonas sp. Of7M-16 TaxID=2917756 RepID=UPI001EF74E18|nr:hypothetical protein [Pseudoalteromonas sp. Of7M-16]MCG7551338.1 hypothetical protein [Pseudoalteromonas sp. Of7M-16]